ncbi:MAG: glycerol-3-phosphate dehydrogenase/oxidase, partial [Planctomycetales bacterium]|nr:glycerol-3-phosphate dehydrogenase/oxidase [Planctomycetales bacterium]
HRGAFFIGVDSTVAMVSTLTTGPTELQRRVRGAGDDCVFDVLVIGGGIVGAGVARDAAMRGLSTALVERRDFASGTSSRSTRLLHGGIRYLAQGRLALVREASKEKTVLQRIAPHLAEPLAFVFPTRKGSDYSRWKLAIGVKIYDLLCGGRNLGRSSSHNVEETLQLAPGLSPDGLTGSARYFDGLTNDARLVIDTLRSASAHGAAVDNYLEFVGASRESNGWRVELRDAVDQREIGVTTRCLVNAAGPWSDRIPGSHTQLRLTKGVHLVVPHSRLPVRDAVVAVEGKRILFAIPWGDRAILGTTDTDYAGPLDEPPCQDEDVAYVLAAVNDQFPEARLGVADVTSVWSGLRPLVADRNGSPSDISRRHEIASSQPGWWDVTGGKLTTYRLMAEETVDSLVNYLGGTFRACRTADEPLLASCPNEPAVGVLPPEPTRDLVAHFCRREWARRLEDVMLRRSSWRHYRADQMFLATQVADWMAAELGWSPETIHQELTSYREIAATAATDSSPAAIEGVTRHGAARADVVRRTSDS